MTIHSCSYYCNRPECIKAQRDSLRDKYVSREWVSLTDDQIKEIIGNWGDTPIKGYTRKLIDQIDAKLKENNT
jgi:hypothetical protein